MMFSSLSKNHTPNQQFRISGRGRSVQQNMAEKPMAYLGPKLWNPVPNEYKTIESLAYFKAKVKTWVPENYPCRLCKNVYSPNRFHLSSLHDNSQILIKSQY